MLGSVTISAITLESALESCQLKKYHRDLLTDSSKREEVGAMSVCGLTAMDCNHHTYGLR